MAASTGNAGKTGTSGDTVDHEASHGMPGRANGLARLSRAVRDRPQHAIVAVLASAAAISVTVAAARAAGRAARLNDFYHEAAPSYLALTHGHLLDFARLTPAYGGSLVLRAPFALLTTLWDGSMRSIYLATALPCMLAAVVFCVWLAAQPRRRGVAWSARIVTLVCCIVNPIVLIVLFGGHPEEVLGAVLCVAAVVCAANGRAEWAGVLLGLAVANKTWALVAVPVVVAALPARRRRALIIAMAIAGTVLLPLVALHTHGLSATSNGANVGDIFNPPQLLWWFGDRSWIVRDARPAIVLTSLVLTVVWCVARRNVTLPTASRAAQPLLLLALVLLLRAALDPWNNLWYHIPFLFALLAFEVRSGRTPVIMAGYTLALLIVVPVGGVISMSTDLRALVYAAVVLPMIAGLAVKLFLPGVLPARVDGGRWSVRSSLNADSPSLP
jgi:hypothetical protein